MNNLVIILVLILPISPLHTSIVKRDYNDNRVEDGHKKLYPIILVPGDGGSQIDAKLNKAEVPHYFCDKKTDDYFNLWLNLALLVPFVIDCWIDNMKLVYDNTSRTTSNTFGVETQVPGLGNTSTVEYVDPSRVPVSGYFNNLVKQLVDFGYERGVSIRGAPYDFRKAPNELADYLIQVKDLIEDTYEINNQTKNILLCHSMGCPTLLYFLNRQTQGWKDKYIQSFITLAAPWAGAVKSMKAFASGDNFGVIVVPSITIREDERTFPSLAYLLPSDKVWGNNEVLMESTLRNYTVMNYREFFEDLNYMTGYNMWLDVKNLTYDMTPPGVEVHCIHGYGLDTMHKLVYNKGKFPDSQPHIVYGDGDGTVNLKSLEACKDWQNKQKQKVVYKAYSKSDHIIVMSDPRVISYIKELAIVN
ncbi:phospholipase A2 group XV-like [Oppia nitens]|uniref:phospholipase A2 group XV-like n=1 Tax=Oppia nitens TaxID=1686743 RepID=UPI0023DA6592|nr:phospholipase A2 group XV-like [Oppia nitens]